MTREEAIAFFKDMNECTYGNLEAVEMAIKALEQEPCDDCVRRQDVLDILKDKWGMFSDANDAMQESIDTIKALKPVTPQPETVTDFADRCRECGAKYGKLLKQDSCKDCVSREAVLNTLDYIDKTLDEDRTVENYKELLKECYEVLPPVTPKPKMGRWIEHFDESGKWYECDQCHSDWGGPVNYCPNCGKKMEGDN